LAFLNRIFYRWKKRYVGLEVELLFIGLLAIVLNVPTMKYPQDFRTVGRFAFGGFF